MGELVTVGVENVPDYIKRLAPKQEAFCKYMAQGNSIVQSGILAGYSVTAGGLTVAYEMKERPEIQAGIAYYKSLYASHSSTSPEKIIAQLATMAQADVTQTVDNQWDTLPKDQIPVEILQAVTGIEVRETRGVKRVILKFNKEFALDQLIKIHGMTKEDHAGKDGLSLTIQLGQQITVEQSVERKQNNYLDIDLTESPL